MQIANDAVGQVDIAIFGHYAEKGGVQRRLANMIKVWVQAGYRVEIISYRGGKCFYPDEIGSLISFVELGTRGKLSTALALWRYCQRTRPRVLLSTAHLANVIVSWLDYLPKIPTRRFLSVPNTFGSSSRRSPAKRARKLKKVKRTYCRADGVIAISEGVRADLVDTIGVTDVPVHLIWNGSVSEENLRRAKEPVAHQWLAGDRSVPVVLSVGRLSAQKDQVTLIDAIARVRQTHECRLIILGEGSLREQLLARAKAQGIEDAFDLPGFQDNPYAWMGKADCFVLSSLWEGFPNVLAEALGVGVPVVSTDCPSGARDILQHGRYGKLVPMGDAAALADAITRVLTGEREVFNVADAVAGFTAEAAAQNYLRVFGLMEAAGGQ